MNAIKPVLLKKNYFEYRRFECQKQAHFCELSFCRIQMWTTKSTKIVCNVLLEKIVSLYPNERDVAESYAKNGLSMTQKIIDNFIFYQFSPIGCTIYRTEQTMLAS